MSRATIDRSATFAWSPRAVGNPLLAAGTLAGALDESFSSESKLDIWDPFPASSATEGHQQDFFSAQGASLKGSVQAPARFVRSFLPATWLRRRFPRLIIPWAGLYRFSRLAWGFPGQSDRPQGVLASGLESGELAIWDPAQVLASNSDRYL